VQPKVMDHSGYIQILIVYIFLTCGDLHRNGGIVRTGDLQDIGGGVGYDSKCHNKTSRIVYFIGFSKTDYYYMGKMGKSQYKSHLLTKS
jgi:hypothetical protein